MGSIYTRWVIREYVVKKDIGALRGGAPDHPIVFSLGGLRLFEHCHVIPTHFRETQY